MKKRMYILIIFVLCVGIYLAWYLMIGRHAQNAGTKRYANETSTDNIDNNSIIISSNQCSRLEITQQDFMSYKEACDQIIGTVSFCLVTNDLQIKLESLPTSMQIEIRRIGILAIPRITGEMSISEFLNFIYNSQLRSPQITVPIGIGEIAPQSEKQKQTNNTIIQSVQKMNLDVSTVKCDLTGINLLEMLGYLSKRINIEIGITGDGKYIFGYNDKWLFGALPEYLVKFSK